MTDVDSCRTFTEVVPAGGRVRRARCMHEILHSRILNDDQRRSNRAYPRGLSRHGEPVGLAATQFPILVRPSQHSPALRQVNRGGML